MLDKSATSVLFWLYMSRNVIDIKWVLILSESLKQNKHVFKFFVHLFISWSQQIQSLENWTKCIHDKNSIWFFSVFYNCLVIVKNEMFLLFFQMLTKRKGDEG